MMGALEKGKNGYKKCTLQRTTAPDHGYISSNFLMTQVTDRNLLQQISEGAVAVNGISES